MSKMKTMICTQIFVCTVQTKRAKWNSQTIFKRQGNKHLDGHNGLQVQSCSVNFYTYTLHPTIREKTLKNACNVDHSITQILTQLASFFAIPPKWKDKLYTNSLDIFNYRFAYAIMQKPTNPRLRNISQLLENHNGFLMNQN